jgi:hypothetical protein
MHIKFNDIPPGKVFEYRGRMFMKLERTTGSHFRSIKINAVCLHTGGECEFSLMSDYVVVRDDVLSLPEKS